MTDKKRPAADEEKPPPTQAEKQAEEAAPAKKTPYVFKILPADPKNSFDFEDVADK